MKRRSPLALVIAVLLLACAAATAAAATSIEGVWSFNGGEIAIQPEGNGKFEGVVVEPTQFAACTHPDGQKIWKELAPQPDGSYWGFHQWYKTEGCALNPVLGPAAFRVISQASGSRYLRVCLSKPSEPTQPQIPVGSAGIDATYGCGSSVLTSALSGVRSFKESVSLPSNRKCFSLRKFIIHVTSAKLDPFKHVSVTLKKHKLKVLHHGLVFTSTINLRGLPRGAFTIRVKATTVRGQTVSGSRTYHTCVKKKTTAKKAK